MTQLDIINNADHRFNLFPRGFESYNETLLTITRFLVAKNTGLPTYTTVTLALEYEEENKNTKGIDITKITDFVNAKLESKC